MLLIDNNALLLFEIVRFVNLMDGHIWIESEGLAKGCTASFIVKLGFPERSNENKLLFVPKVQANHVQINFAGLKVLVMDDNGLVMLPCFQFPFSFLLLIKVSVSFY